MVREASVEELHIFVEFLAFVSKVRIVYIFDTRELIEEDGLFNGILADLRIVLIR